MNTKITSDHLGRAAVVYVRQSTMAQVTGNLESQLELRPKDRTCSGLRLRADELARRLIS